MTISRDFLFCVDRAYHCRGSHTKEVYDSNYNVQDAKNEGKGGKLGESLCGYGLAPTKAM